MGDINKESVARAYARWAPVYDAVFGKVFAPGRAAAIEAAEKHCGSQGGRILEVGVGTGISLPAYRSVNRITGIDISGPMLRKAAERVAAHGLKNVEALSVMDAANLALPNESFDVVVAQFVITAVPDPEGTLDEFVRVLKRDGEIILVNHIGAESGPRWLFEQGFAPIARRLGWRPEFPFKRLTDWAARHGGRSGRWGISPWSASPTRREREPSLHADRCSGIGQREAFMSIRMLGLAIVTAALLPELAAAQAPPAAKTPRPPAATTPSQSGNCAPNAPATTGQAGDVDVSKPDGSNLSQKLAQSNGVLCPPEQGDHAMEAPPPPAGRTPVIKPPGTPGSSDQSVQPK